MGVPSAHVAFAVDEELSLDFGKKKVGIHQIAAHTSDRLYADLGSRKNARTVDLGVRAVSCALQSKKKKEAAPVEAEADAPSAAPAEGDAELDVDIEADFSKKK